MVVLGKWGPQTARGWLRRFHGRATRRRCHGLLQLLCLWLGQCLTRASAGIRLLCLRTRRDHALVVMVHLHSYVLRCNKSLRSANGL